MSPDERLAYYDGQQARAAGVDSDQCPYADNIHHGSKRRAWLKGWSMEPLEGSKR